MELLILSCLHDSAESGAPNLKVTVSEIPSSI